MQASLASTLAALARAFESATVEWFLFGAQAALLRGSRRMTADVDVTVLLGEVSSRRLLDILAFESIVPRFEFDEEFVRQARVLPLIHEQRMPIDIVLGSPGLDEYFLERAEQLEVEGVSLRVPVREDLISMKLLAGRPHDMQDAEAMLRGGPVDVDELRRFVDGLAEALADDEIRRRLDVLLARHA